MSADAYMLAEPRPFEEHGTIGAVVAEVNVAGARIEVYIGVGVVDGERRHLIAWQGTGSSRGRPCIARELGLA